MDKESKKILDKILAKDPSWLTENDKAILRARITYLTKAQKKTFANTLKETRVADEAEDKIDE